MSKISFIDQLEVKEPCSQKWEEMSGSDEVRFCSHCEKSVSDLSAITRKQAMRLVRKSGGKLCVRYIQHPVTQRPLFSRQLAQITRRLPQISAGAISATLALATNALAQEPAPAATPMPAAERPVDDAAKKATEPIEPTGRGRLFGTVLDPNGAVIPGATVAAISIDGTREVVTNEEGKYELRDLKFGRYRVEIGAMGFAKQIRELTLERDADEEADGSLEVAGPDVVVEVSAGIDSTLSVATTGVVAMTVSYRTELANAIAEEDVDRVRELIANGADVNEKEDKETRLTPIFIAVETGDVEIVQILLDAGAKVTARTRDKQTPLMRLDEDASAELVDLLIKHGVSLDAADEDGDTALIRAAEFAPAAVIKALIRAGADVNAVNKAGQTALMNAAYADDVEAVKSLLEAGAKADLKNRSGETAWDLTDDAEIEKLLESYGATPKEKERAEEDDEPDSDG